MHRPKHKKECKIRAAELHDEELFKEIPKVDCPICFLPLPIPGDDSTYKSCCGKMLCNGCIIGVADQDENRPCPFCREPTPTTSHEMKKRMKRRMECGDGEAFKNMAALYVEGSHGMPLDLNKAREMNLRAGELGCVAGYFNLGTAFDIGRGVGVDYKKAKRYYELATKGGHIIARYNLGCMERDTGNFNRAIKHLMIAARSGHKLSLDAV